MSGQQHAPAALWPRERPGTHLQEAGWAPGPVWTGGKARPHRDSIPDRPVRSSVAIPTELPGPPPHTHTHTLTHIYIYIYIYLFSSQQRQNVWCTLTASVLHKCVLEECRYLYKITGERFVLCCAFEKFLTATMSYVIPVCRSARLFAWNNSAVTGRNLMEFDIAVFFEGL